MFFEGVSELPTFDSGVLTFVSETSIADSGANGGDAWFPCDVAANDLH